MRARPPLARTDILLRHIEAAPEMARLRELSEEFSMADPDTVAAILGEAARFAQGEMDPLNDVSDAQGCRMEDGRVIAAHGHACVYKAFVEGGWVGLDLKPEYGGQGLPLMVTNAAQEIFDRSGFGFGMLPVANRGAAKLIDAWADEALKAEWLEPITTGKWGATICISEADAGSDAPRMRTTGRKGENGDWRITGEKHWISYGDHNLTERIGHCMLARTEGAKGLSLFLVPNHIDGAPNGVVARRIEHKLGLHASPTCAMGFEDARGWLLGEEGRGLSQMFVMITSMRLAAGTQGTAMAACSSDIALQYAEDRRQGGSGDTPVAIAEHTDVQRQLMDMVAELETTRSLGLALSGHADLANHDPDDTARAESHRLLSWLLPIYKTIGGECGINVANQSIQVLGGAGYTREWPVEQCLRDCRVLTIFEGTTGIQGLDLLHRRLWRDKGAGLETFSRLFRAVIPDLPEDLAVHANASLDLLESAARQLGGMAKTPRQAEAGATAFLELAGLAARGWSATRLVSITGQDAASRRLRAAGRYWLSGLSTKAQYAYDQAIVGDVALSGFSDIRIGDT